jgi:transposase InsO family protein
MDVRREFVGLALAGDGERRNIALLCRRFGISRKTGYKWIGRYTSGSSVVDLADRSRRPRCSPTRTSESLQRQVIELRERHRAWGGRKLAARLKALGCPAVPAPSTISGILRRAGLLEESQSEMRRTPKRFEYESANELWQMDYKGHVAMTGGGRCHPLTVLDDHSRYSLVLAACADEQATTVQRHLTSAFRRYGLPRRMLADNGSPWGTSWVAGGTDAGAWTGLAVWLLRLGVRLMHGRPRHPQTQGKEERFHRTLKAELLRWQRFADLSDAQKQMDPWRFTYNHERPHEALGMSVPASRYRPSPRAFPERLPAIEYGPDDQVRRVRPDGRIVFFQQKITIGAAFGGEDVALRPTRDDGVWDAFYCDQPIGRIDRRNVGSEGRLRLHRPLAPLAGDAAARACERG